MVKKNKRQQNIKTKLIAAICMLLVSSIMMVSSTYAWFTLSTAPEVTGITTSVGANGNLEMALVKDLTMQDFGITSAAGDSVRPWSEKNLTWGNLVNVSDATVYGMDKITLFPAKLNYTTDANGVMTLAAAMLKTPAYGADGRVSELLEKTTTGVYNSTSGTFVPDSGNTVSYGVRAVGTASGMTDRQISYRNARSAANTATSQAKTLASQSLNNNGSALANIAIEYGMSGANAKFGTEDVASLRAIINDLNGTEGVLAKIEYAYMQYILGYAASKASGTEDTVWKAVKGAVEADGATLTTVVNTIGKDKLPDAVTTAIDKLEATKTSVANANDALTDLEESNKTEFTWEEIKTAMEPLANPAKMKVNGYLASEVKDKLGDLVSSVTSQGGLKVIMETGAGVYADIADQCGDYTASVNIEKVEYGEIVLNNMAARMETDSSVDPSYLNAIGTAVETAGAPASGATGTMPISDMYGYIIDMAFRTNASDSSLLLQTTPVDRIYSTNENGVTQTQTIDGKEVETTTMGGGSTMTFAATTTDFSNDQVKGLMRAVRIVFFVPGTNTVLATAKLDVDKAVVTADGIVANIYLYTSEAQTTTTYRAATATEIATHAEVTVDGETTYVAATLVQSATDASVYEQPAEGVAAEYAEVTGTDGAKSYVKATFVEVNTVSNTTVDTLITNQKEAEITALTRGTAQAVSVLVYLDGESITNKDVAATDSTSMTGKMNLQFASSATLNPMDYTELMEQGENAEADGE